MSKRTGKGDGPGASIVNLFADLWPQECAIVTKHALARFQGEEKARWFSRL